MNDEMANELGNIAYAAVAQFAKVADKYGKNRNEIIVQAAAALLEMAAARDYTNFIFEEVRRGLV
jgi:hypothetical protein